MLLNGYPIIKTENSMDWIHNKIHDMETIVKKQRILY